MNNELQDKYDAAVDYARHCEYQLSIYPGDEYFIEKEKLAYEAVYELEKEMLDE